LEVRAKNALGECFEYEVNAAPLLQEGAAGMILSLARDVTDRKRAEEALRQAEEKYRTLVDRIHDGVFIIQDDKMQFVNDAFAHMVGYAVGEVLGMHFRELVAPEDIELVADRYRRRQAGEEVPSSYEFRMLHKDQNTRLTVEMEVSLISYQGKVASMGTVRDITAQKRAEEDKQRLQEQLFQARKLEALGTLAGGVAHDFNNILSAIMGFTELATDDISAETTAQRNLEEVLKASRRAKSLVQQILTFSRPGQPQHEPVQIRPVVEEVVAFLRASSSKNIEVRCQVETTGDVVAMSITYLQQVLTNLCSNAIQAMGEGGGTLEVGVRRVKVERAVTCTQGNLQPGSYVKLTVSDTGCGMTPEVLQRVFEPFFTTRSVGEGNGLGLAIVHGIVTGHGGAIGVDSAPDRGTTFHVYLPASRTGDASENVPYCSSAPEQGDSPREKGVLSYAAHLNH
jgi:PAS domain S-box-containing protein